MTTMISRTALAMVVCALALNLCGCSWSIGGGKREGPVTEQTTRGQELIDLKKARDQGAITPEEYEAQKSKVLGR